MLPLARHYGDMQRLLFEVIWFCEKHPGKPLPWLLVQRIKRCLAPPPPGPEGIEDEEGQECEYD